MVNGVSMENVNSTFAIQILKTCTKLANIVSGGRAGAVAPGSGAPLPPAEPRWVWDTGAVCV